MNWKVPGAQRVLLVCPVLSTNDPAPLSWHDMDPLLGVNEPRMQLKHTLVPYSMEYVPARHGIHFFNTASLVCCPGGHIFPSVIRALNVRCKRYVKSFMARLEHM